MLTPKATLTNRCRGMGRPMRSWMRFINTSALMPRAPPPSMQTTPAPAVGGCTLTAMGAGGACPQRRQRRTLKVQGSSSLRFTNTSTQFSQMQCPQGRGCCGLLSRQQKHVLLL